MNTKTLIGIVCAMLVGQSAMARERFQLHLNDAEYRGGQTIPLKQLLQQQYNIRPNEYELVGVRLVAKSQHGQGTAALKVGNWQSNAMRVYGNPQDWNRPGPRTFSDLDFNNNSRRENGVWQILLNGNIKVRKVVVIAERNFGGGGGGGGGGRIENIRCDSINSQPNQCQARGQIMSIRLLQQHSNSACVLGQSFGANGNYVVVNRGCRGTFEVRTR